MNKFTVVIIVFCLTIPIFSQELTGLDIVKKASEVMNQDQVKGIMELTITTSTGQKRTFLYESFSKNKGEKNLLRYLEPSRVKGQAILMMNNADDIWVYFPRTKRVRKLATHAKKQKMEGSDFSYEDFGSGDSFIEDFIQKRLNDVKIEGDECYQVELTAKAGIESSYSRMLIAVRKSDFSMLKIDYYDEKDPGLQIKQLIIQEIKVIQGIPTATMMVMKSLDDNTETVMVIKSVDYNVDLPDDMFTERGLRK